MTYDIFAMKGEFNRPIVLLRFPFAGYHVRIQRGDRGSGPPPPLKNRKNIGFPSNIGPDPLIIPKLPSQHSMLGHHQHASETPFKWRFAGWLIIARL